jgi:hypothetical protein
MSTEVIPTLEVDPNLSPVVAPVAEPKPTNGSPEVVSEEEKQNQLILSLYPEMIVKEGDEFVFKPKPIVKDGVTLEPTTVGYRAKSAKELFDKINEGIVEKDTYFTKVNKERYQTRLSPLKPEAPRREAQPVATEQVDPEQVKQEVYGKLIRETGIEPKYLQYTPQQWREHEAEYGVSNTMMLQQDTRQFLKTYSEQVNKEVNYRKAEQFNRQLAGDLDNSITDYLVESNIDISEDQLVALRNEAVEQENAWSGDRFNANAAYRNFVRLVQKVTKPKSAVAASVQEDINRLKNLPPGVKTETARVAPIDTKTKPDIKSFQDGTKAVEDLIRRGQTKI